MREKKKFFFTIEFQLINVEGIMELENVTTIMVRNRSSNNHQSCVYKAE